MKLSTITSRCGSAALMGWGIALLALAVAGAAAAAGTLLIAVNTLHDAMVNAAMSWGSASTPPTAAQYASTVSADLGGGQFSLLHYATPSNGQHWTIDATGRWRTATLWPSPAIQVTATIP